MGRHCLGSLFGLPDRRFGPPFCQAARKITVSAVELRPETFDAPPPALPTAVCIKDEIGRPRGCMSTRFPHSGSDPVPPRAAPGRILRVSPGETRGVGPGPWNRSAPIRLYVQPHRIGSPGGLAQKTSVGEGMSSNRSGVVVDLGSRFRFWGPKMGWSRLVPGPFWGPFLVCAISESDH